MSVTKCNKLLIYTTCGTKMEVFMWNRKKITLILGASMMMLPQFAFGKTVGTVNANVLNVRSNPTATSSIVKKVYAKESVQIVDLVGTSDVWYKVDIQGTKAYIKREYLTLTKADGTVKATSLNIRSYPDTQKSKIIGSLKSGTNVEVLYKVNDFYKIMVNGSAGFVSSQYIDCKYGAYISTQPLSNVGEIPVWTGGTTTTNSSKGEKVVDTAMKYLGNPYVYGGTSLTNGTDCSGFTQSVMKIHGVTIPRTSIDQSKVGALIAKANLQKGDLLFFGSSASAISHCGIYIGDGKMIHASTPSTGIIISGAYTSGGVPLQVIRRVI